MSLQNNIFLFFSKASFITKSIGFITLLLYLISFIPGSISFLSITPGYLIPPKLYIWTLVTFTFFDNHFYCVIINIITLFFSNNLLEPLWGQNELLKYLIIVSVTSGFICFFICYFLYLFTYSVKFLFETHIHGMIAFSAAVTVAVRQTLPDDIILTLPVGNVKNTHLSFIGIILTLVFAFFHFVNFIYPVLYFIGINVSWIYLRFYQKHSNGHYGDCSDTFEFAGFFPNHLKPPVSVLSNALFSLLVRLRICKKMERLVTINPVSVLASNSKDPVETERRKALALKALNDRLNRKSDATPWPSVSQEASSSLESMASEKRQDAAKPLSTASPKSPVGDLEISTDKKTLSALELKNLPLPDFKNIANATVKVPQASQPSLPDSAEPPMDSS